MCLISSQPSLEAGIAQVLMRHLLLRTPESGRTSGDGGRRLALLLQTGACQDDCQEA